jgi:predicted CoA-binding protein
MMNKKTLVIGANTNPVRYSFLAIKKLLAYHHTVVALGIKAGLIDTLQIDTAPIPYTAIDTITLYINAQRQINYYAYILSLHPKRIIFNPGTENDELAALAKKNNITTIEACTLVLLSTGQY